MSADLAALPRIAAWRLHGAHEGFEVARFAVHDDGVTVTGMSTGVQDGAAWSFRYALEIDADWHTVRAQVESGDGTRLVIARAGDGRWYVDGVHDPALDGCVDVDLEGSATTNTIPVHRLQLAVHAHADAPAAYVRASTLRVERLDQTYTRLPDRDGDLMFDYAAPRFGYQAHLRFARDGLVIDYPDIAQRQPLTDTR